MCEELFSQEKKIIPHCFITLLFWGVTHIFIFLIDQKRAHLFHYLSHFPTTPELLKSYLRASSQEIARVLSQTVRLGRQRRGKAPRSAPEALAGSWGPGKERGTHGLRAPGRSLPRHPQIRGTLWRPIRHPERAFLSPASLPRSPQCVRVRRQAKP